MFRCMAVRAQRQNFPSQFPVASQNILCGVWVTQSIFKARTVTFQSNALFNQSFENFVQNIPVSPVRIIFVFLRAVAYHIVNMPTGIKAGESFQVFQNHFKLQIVGLVLGSALIKIFLIGVQTVGYMDGADEKVKVRRSGKGRNFLF